MATNASEHLGPVSYTHLSVQGGDEQKIADQIRGIFEAEQL